MAKRILVIGLGRFGAALAEELSKQGIDVIAADRQMKSVDSVKDSVTLAVELDTTDPRALESVEATACDAAIVAIGEDFESAILSVAALKEIGVKHIIARARSEREGRVFSAVGAHEVILIEPEMGRALARRLRSEPSVSP
jgi:trk system potassium uptake protein TrkA